MNNTLAALGTQYRWKINALYQAMQSIDTQCAELENNLCQSQAKLQLTQPKPQTILPEQEIARMHWVTNEQQQQAALTRSKQALIEQQTTLEAEHLQLNIALKRLEKYQDKQAITAQQQAAFYHQKSADEWALRRPIRDR